MRPSLAFSDDQLREMATHLLQFVGQMTARDERIVRTAADASYDLLSSDEALLNRLVHLYHLY
jgi:hypothetical protein